MSPLKPRTPFWGNLYRAVRLGWKAEKHPREESEKQVRERESASIGLKHPGIILLIRTIWTGTLIAEKVALPVHGKATEIIWRRLREESLAFKGNSICTLCCRVQEQTFYLSFLSQAEIKDWFYHLMRSRYVWGTAKCVKINCGLAEFVESRQKAAFIGSLSLFCATRLSEASVKEANWLCSLVQSYPFLSATYPVT